MNKEVAISVQNVSKTFRIPHEKITSVRGAVVGSLKRLNLGLSQNTSKGSTLGGGNYEEFKALDDVSFEVHPVKSAKSGAKQFNRVKKGEFFGVIGRNGSGKSTLLKVLASIILSVNYI